MASRPLPTLLTAFALALLVAGCAAAPPRGDAIEAARSYLRVPVASRQFPGAVPADPVVALDSSGLSFHSWLVPLKGPTGYVGVGVYVPGRPLMVTPFRMVRQRWMVVDEGQARSMAEEATKATGPFRGARFDGPFIVYREPRGYAWAVRFRRDGVIVVSGGESLIDIAKVF